MTREHAAGLQPERGAVECPINGYTAEYDLSLWILKVRALVSAWGTTSFHRARVLDALTTEA